MKKIFLISTIVAMAANCAYADYYRSTGGGYYELYVDDCSREGMQAALENAVAERKAVITVVKCAAEYREPVRYVEPAPYVEQVRYVGPEPIEIDPCSISCAPVCGCRF